jgi:hypothetical protein
MMIWLAGLPGSMVAAQAQTRFGEQVTLRGEIVSVLCYQQGGAAAGTGVAHLPCAKEDVKRGGLLGILTDGDGLFRIVGEYRKDNYAKVVGYLAKQVEVSGKLTRHLDYSTAIDLASIKPLGESKK